jgi:rRNA maturation endonuclease Nob1
MLDIAETMINHECDPHCIGCYNIHWNAGDPFAACNECGHRVDLLDQLSTSIVLSEIWLTTP